MTTEECKNCEFFKVTPRETYSDYCERYRCSIVIVPECILKPKDGKCQK